ncbi:MAG TPA: ECF-type sigma factor [Candidatus Paceibacterota bacterium]|nr:ECF-type sigma factor [Candidatus Paceibacterota bacterium]
MSNITLVLDAISKGEGQAAEKLLPLVYNELRNLAAARMLHESAGHTLQPTALVHEAWLRLVGEGSQNRKGRAYFFAAAEAMRRILVEHARRKGTVETWRRTGALEHRGIGPGRFTGTSSRPTFWSRSLTGSRCRR